jgi:hypothetical protein
MQCTNGSSVTRAYGDMTTCLQREKLACLDALAARNNGNNPERVEGCVKALATESCSDYLAGNTPAACVNTGTLPDGTACAFGGQCASTYCTGTTNAMCGQCGQPVAAGGDCSAGGTCARGQTCFSAPTGGGQMTMTCLTEGGAGAACSRTTPCAAGLSCVGAINQGPMAMNGSCMAAVATAGGACDPIQRTAPGCDRSIGLFCNTTSKTCTAITFAADGAACGIGPDGNLIDCSNGTCYGSVTTGANQMMGTCKANAADGAACDAVNGPDCQAPARCVTASGSSTGACILPNGNAC